MEVKRIVSILFGCLFLSFSFAQDHERIVEITTNYGVIKVKLYNETPIHRDNFIKLVNEGFYDSTLFHRVINQFMIQGGDPKSKGAAPEVQLGNGGPGYTLPAEINPSFIHKKGALAAARQGDQVNPQKRSSGSQFYIVQGRTYSLSDMEKLKQRNEQVQKQKLINEFFLKPENKEYLTRLKEIRTSKDKEAMKILIDEIEPLIDEEYKKNPNSYTDEQLKIYAEIGGTPHLDGNYTIFGEVIEGLDVVDKIAAAETQPGDRPTIDIWVKMKVIE